MASGEGVTAIAASDPGHVWAFGDGFLLSTVDSSGDTAAPLTLTDAASAWHRKPLTAHFSASDGAGWGGASTQFSTDDGSSWQTGTAVTIDAPADHANDGEHTVLYRSTDAAGNQEQTESLQVGIDTLGPVCGAPRRSVANAGQTGTLYFMANDANSGVARIV